MPQFDFLNNYLNEILESHKIFLTAKQKAEYLPQLRAQLEQRLGAAFIPLLSEDAHKEFGHMLTKENVIEEDWKQFWHAHVPNFEEEVGVIMNAFAREVGEILAPV